MKVIPTKALKEAFKEFAATRDMQLTCIEPITRAAMGYGRLLMKDGTPAENFDELMRDFGMKPEDGETYSASEKRSMALGTLLTYADHAFVMRHNEMSAMLLDFVQVLDTARFEADPYIRNIKIPTSVHGDCSVTMSAIEPCSFFQYDTCSPFKYNLQIPHIGIFEKRFEYPVLRRNRKAIMSVAPNEIITMEKHVEAAHGNVLALGLGLGYYAYMASRKDDVDHVTVIESDEDVIGLFTEHILPQFDHPEKIRIIQDNAMAYMANLKDGEFDACFADIWSNPAESMPYVLIKQLTRKFRKTKVSFWIEDAMLGVLADYACIIATRNIFRVMDMENIDLKKGEAPKNELVMLDFMNRLMSREIIDRPERLIEATSPAHVEKLLLKRKTELVPVSG